MALKRRGLRRVAGGGQAVVRGGGWDATLYWTRRIDAGGAGAAERLGCEACAGLWVLIGVLGEWRAARTAMCRNATARSEGRRWDCENCSRLM